ncbi:MAG TPA: hypothetical protein VN941_01270 [Bradyrhizobium sp.]|nr:hypothetical protein [Bradyrhizobium sp.]
MPHVPPKNALERKAKRDHKQRKANEYNRRRQSADFAALIDTIKDEGSAYRKEEQREDRGKRFREYITIFLIAATFTAVCYQVYEMIKVYEPIREQAEASGKQAIEAKRAADATVKAAEAAIKQSEIAAKQAEYAEKSLTQAQRAWIGPTNASFVTEPKVGEPLDIAIFYQNSGREPALNFSYEADLFPVGEQSSEFGNRVVPFMTKCLERNTLQPGQVVYPSSGFSQYNLSMKSAPELVDDAVVSGEKVIVLQGCFVYLTGQIMRHSFFCYFYKSKFSKISNLNICQAGHSAD